MPMVAASFQDALQCVVLHPVLSLHPGYQLYLVCLSKGCTSCLFHRKGRGGLCCSGANFALLCCLYCLVRELAPASVRFLLTGQFPLSPFHLLSSSWCLLLGPWEFTPFLGRKSSGMEFGEGGERCACSMHSVQPKVLVFSFLKTGSEA